MTPEPEPKRLTQTYVRMHRDSVTFGDLLYAKGGSFGPRLQMDFQLVVIHSGCLSLELDDETIDVPESHGILLSPGHREHFFFAQDRDTHHSWVAVAPHALNPELHAEFAALRGPIPFLGHMARLLAIVKRNAAPFLGPVSLQNGLCQGLAISILCDFASAVSAGHKIATCSDMALLQMERFLDDRYARPLGLKDIARAAGVSQQHLLKLCRATGKPTPIKQLYAKRLEVAADLLLHTGFSVAEIAEQCGFVNQFHFSRKFKDSVGRSPLAWRNELWKSGQRI
jgi:AraC family transcriptional regulator of arabinose operon